MKRTRLEKVRLSVLYIFIVAFFVIAVGRLIHLQVFLSPRYSQIVIRQSSGTVKIPADRGLIFDRQGTVIANNVIVSSLYAYPTSQREVQRVATYLEKTLALKPGSARKKYNLRTKKFSWVKRMLSDEMARKILAEAPGGLHLRQEKRRKYPFGTVGKQLIGFTDIDNTGRSGFELFNNDFLAGKVGQADIRRDGLRNTYRVKETALMKPVPGKSYVLTADWQLQEIVEEELKASVERYNAKAAMAVFLDCNNGDLLAAAHYDPTEKLRDKPVKLRAITDQFEPGSVFKIFTAAGLMDAGLVNYSDSTYCEMGKWKMGRRILHDDKEKGWLSFREIMELSSNIGFAKYAIEMGGEQLLETASKFGIGKKTGIGLPGETSGRLAKPSRWSDYNIAALAMGHSVTVSALHLAAGMVPIANGGKMYKPRLILGEVDRNGYIINRRQPELIGHPISEISSDSLRSFLCGVVDHGTAEMMKSKMIAIGGKTGTAQMVDHERKRYFNNRFVGSFVGFFPAEKPLIVGVVIMLDPQPIHYGGYTAGPTFRNVAERYAILHPQLLSDTSRILAQVDREESALVETPDLLGRTLVSANDLVNRKNLLMRGGSDSGFVVWQYPLADRLIFAGDEILVITSDGTEENNSMIDLSGLSVREVSAYLGFFGIRFEINGNGLVCRQSIRPGEKLTKDSYCRLECRPI